MNFTQPRFSAARTRLLLLIVLAFAAGEAWGEGGRELQGFPSIQLGEDQESVLHVLPPGETPVLRSAYPSPLKSFWLRSGLVVGFVEGHVVEYGFQGNGKGASFNGVSVGSPAADVDRLLGKPDGTSSYGMPVYLDRDGRRLVVGIDKSSQTVYSLLVIADAQHAEFDTSRTIPPTVQVTPATPSPVPADTASHASDSD